MVRSIFRIPRDTKLVWLKLGFLEARMGSRKGIMVS